MDRTVLTRRGYRHGIEGDSRPGLGWLHGVGLFDLPRHHQPLSPLFAGNRFASRPRCWFRHLLPPAVALAESAHRLSLHLKQVAEVVEGHVRVLVEDVCQHLLVVVLDGSVADVAEVARLVDYRSGRPLLTLLCLTLQL